MNPPSTRIPTTHGRTFEAGPAGETPQLAGAARAAGRGLQPEPGRLRRIWRYLVDRPLV